MGVDYYIYATIKEDQYLIGEGRYELISRWYDMLLAYKSPSLIAIVHERDYLENWVHGNQFNRINLELTSGDNELEKYRFDLQVELVEGTHYIDPYDTEHEWYKLLQKYEEYQKERELKLERWRKEDEEWNALSDEERKRISDEQLKEALRIVKEGRDNE